MIVFITDLFLELVEIHDDFQQKMKEQNRNKKRRKIQTPTKQNKTTNNFSNKQLKTPMQNQRNKTTTGQSQTTKQTPPGGPPWMVGGWIWGLLGPCKGPAGLDVLVWGALQGPQEGLGESWEGLGGLGLM